MKLGRSIAFALALALVLAAGGGRQLSAQAGSPAVSITLDPASGPPGAIVQISGVYPGVAAGARPNAASGHVDLCWDGCPGGLAALAVPVQWSDTTPGGFGLSFTVPQAPWLTADGPHDLAAGDYTVGLQCLTPPGGSLAGGCATRGPDASATFTLADATPTGCPPVACGSLSLTPNPATPGQFVSVSGVAPLATLGGGNAFAYSLTIDGAAAVLRPLAQAPDGSFSDAFRLPLALPDLGVLAPGAHTLALHAGTAGGNIDVASAELDVQAPPAWSDLGAPQPLRIERSENLLDPAFATDPGNAGRLAFCEPGDVQLSRDGGVSWNPLSIASAGDAAAANGFQLFGQDGGAACTQLVLPAGRSSLIYAAFPAALAEFGAPPIFFLPFESTDAGQSWQLVPAPDGYEAKQFGGFQVVNGAVQALFAMPTEPDSPPALAVEEAMDDGSWQAVALNCAGEGPCLRFGAGPNAIGSCAMNERVQALFYSTDGGASFQPPAAPATVNACDLNELAPLSPMDALLLAGRADFPLQVTHDGGQSFGSVTLPPLPDADPSLPAQYRGLQILPDGSLLAQTQAGDGWLGLCPGASAWQSTNIPGSAIASTLRVLNSRLWWLQRADDGSLHPFSLPPAAAGCRGGAGT
ncbi:MAG TPA: hypothetical protein VKV26_01105 [Dehalococcoidia bacterium]|nr:hypothetical protein [Dehalococcoidia bacterium]